MTGNANLNRWIVQVMSSPSNYASVIVEAATELTTLLERAEKAEGERDELEFLLHEGGTMEGQLSKAEARVVELEQALSDEQYQKAKLQTRHDFQARRAETALGDDPLSVAQLLNSAAENLRGGSKDEETRIEAAWRIASQLDIIAKELYSARAYDERKKALTAERETAIRERDELRKALEPFIRLADEIFSDGKNENVTDGIIHWYFNDISITFGDLRRARASSDREGGEE